MLNKFNVIRLKVSEIMMYPSFKYK